MGELGSISGKETIRRFCRLGYVVARQRGSHVRLHHKNKPPLTIPLQRELKIGLLKQLIQDAGIDSSVFINLK